MKLASIAVLVVALGLGACAGGGAFPASGRRINVAKMAQVEAAARVHFVDVVWVNAPLL